MNRLDLQPGHNLLVGRPAKPMPRRLAKKFSAVLSAFEEIREAHVPEVFVVGATKAASRVLFIVVDPETAIDDVMDRLADGLRSILRNYPLEIWPVGSTHEIIPTVREADCLIGWRD